MRFKKIYTYVPSLDQPCSKSISSAINQSVIHYIKCHYHHTVSVKRVKSTSTRGTSANKTYCNMKHCHLCINSVTSGNIWSCYLSTYCMTVLLFGHKTDKTEQNWINEDKCVNSVVWMWPFYSLRMVFLLQRPVLSIIVIRLIPVRAVTAQRRGCPRSTPRSVQHRRRQNDWTNKHRSAVTSECTSDSIRAVSAFNFISARAQIKDRTKLSDDINQVRNLDFIL